MSSISHRKFIFSVYAIVSLSIFLCSTPGFGRGHIHYGDGFTVDLDEPFNLVLKVVQSVAEDGIVRGSGEYKGTTDMFGAVPDKTSDAFKKSAEDGTVLYKIRKNSIAPDHFDASNDIGTVTVRYVVKSVGPKATRLWIDAIFVEDSHHHRHQSDGTVENAEFLAIADNIKTIEDQEAKRRQDALYAKQQEQLSALQAEIEQQKNQLNAAKTRQQELEKKIGQLRGGKLGHIRTSNAALKSAPYTQAETLQSLAQNDPVTVLLRTRSWYRVQTSSGAEGWVYGLMIEVDR